MHPIFVRAIATAEGRPLKMYHLVPAGPENELQKKFEFDLATRTINGAYLVDGLNE